MLWLNQCHYLNFILPNEEYWEKIACIKLVCKINGSKTTQANELCNAERKSAMANG